VPPGSTPRRPTRRAITAAAVGAVGVAAAGVAASTLGRSRAAETGAAPSPSSATADSAHAPAAPGWILEWEDGFDLPALDTATWTVVQGPGQSDLRDQHVNDPAMVRLEGGNLVVTARREDADGLPYRAGSITTRGKRTLGPHGRLTSWQLLTAGTGVGVGVALFGQDIDEVGWPACGEIDATEIALGRPGAPFGSVHGPGYSGGAAISGTYAGPLTSVVDRWVEHTLDWNAERIEWALDGVVYQTARRDDPRATGGWPFDQPCFVQVFVTVGSFASGDVDLADWPVAADGVPEFTARFDGIRFERWQS